MLDCLGDARAPSEICNKCTATTMTNIASTITTIITTSTTTTATTTTITATTTTITTMAATTTTIIATPTITTTAPDSSTLIIIITVAGVVVLALAGLGAVALSKSKYGSRNTMATSTRDDDDDLIDLLVMDRTSSDYANVGQDVLLAREQIVLGKVLGEGHFGKVFDAIVHLHSGTVVAAVKQPNLKIPNAAADFEDEIAIVTKVHQLGGHANIVGLVGFVRGTGPQEASLLALESCALGDLKTFLRKEKAMAAHDLLPLCVHVAAGMGFLETNLIVHRDLAARNVLLTSEKQCKVADFGLSRNTAGKDYYRRNAASAPIPVRWMALETLKFDISTVSSDCWSFGVLMWEMFTFGERPYAGLQNKEILAHIKAGNRLEHPPSCPSEVYTLMLECWDAKPGARPTFNGTRGLTASLIGLDATL